MERPDSSPTPRPVEPSLRWLALGIALAAGTLTGGGGAVHGPRPQGGPERLKLDNGLQVILHGSPGAKTAALVVLFSIGEAHDPAGKSGMAHFIEHCYVTAAAGEMKAMDVRQYMARYPKGWNAQTGFDYTVIAAVVQSERVDKELVEAATRMGQLRIEESDLVRERPRMDVELRNMYGGIPKIAAANHASSAAFPAPAGARKGGVQEQIAGMTVAELRDRVARYYKPRNATLVVVGGFDVPKVRARVRELFGKLPEGDPLPARRKVPEPRLGGDDTIEVAKPRFGPAKGYGAVAYRAPAPDSELFAPFLVLVARLTQQGIRRRNDNPDADYMPQWTPVDGPEVLKFSAASSAADDVPAHLRDLVSEICKVPGRETAAAVRFAEQYCGFLLGLAPITDRMIAQGNIYGIAFGYARRHQLGIDPGELKKRLKRVKAADLRRCAVEVFGPDRSAGAIVKIKAP